jgi:YesN/AraC family two-component response regulator
MEPCFEKLPTIHSMGLCMFAPVWAENEHSSANNELYHIIKGKVEFVSNGSKFEAKSGDILFVPKRTIHRDNFDMSSEFEVYMIHFSWEAEGQFNEKVENKSINSLSKKQKNEILKIFDEFKSQEESDLETDELIARSRLHSMLLLMLRGAEAPKEGKASQEIKNNKRKRLQIMLQAKNYLERRYHEPLTLEQIATDLGVSTYYLSRVFSAESSFSLFNYLTTLRMDKAKAMLAEGNMNVSEVAQSVGYENSNYFSKVFKRTFGISPSESANLIRQK